MKYTVRHRVVTDYLRDVEEESKVEAIRKAKYLSIIDHWLDPNERRKVTDLGWTTDVEDQDEEVANEARKGIDIQECR